MRAHKSIDPQIRFWRQVDKTGDCWVWRGCKTIWGYGKIRLVRPRRTVSAHRFSWQISSGEIPSGLLVLHKCDNRVCVRPDHLFLGTQKDNIQDCIKKGRWPVKAIGRRGRVTNLDEDQARTVRHLYNAERRSQRELATFFKVSRNQISEIVNMRRLTSPQ